jgi:ubiquinone/menaquinone biosynthesis C-methylase UbiE
MGFYRDQVFPRGVDLLMNTKSTREIRARVCAGLAGDVVEIGFGSGHNLPYLPTTVTRLRAVDPSALGLRLAAQRIAASPVPVESAGLDGQSLPFADESADAVLSTWTLCSIPDAVAALREVRRVLRPGGTFHFVEHGTAPDASVRKWQDRLNPLQQRFAGGCNLNRDIPALIEAGGLHIERLATYYNEGDLKVMGYTYEGVATPA